MINNRWLESGLEAIWLPYSHANSCLSSPVLPVKSAEGCYITLSDGAVLIDAISCWWVMCHGYSQPHIVNSMKRQIESMPHIMLANFAVEETYKLSARITGLTGMSKVLFAESGSMAADVGLRLALAYHGDDVSRRKFIYFENGYHGETLSTLKASDVRWGCEGDNYKFKIPNNCDELRMLRESIADIAHEVAAVIIEPLAQCAGGMKFYSEEMLLGIYDIARECGLLFIADEIATGFYRVGGEMFACARAGIKPDILLLGKAMTGGHCGGGAIVVQRHISEAFREKAFMYGTTFMGNPLVCAAANASLDLFARFDASSAVAGIERCLRVELESFRNFEVVSDVRVLGAIGVIEFCREVDMRILWNSIIKAGVWLRPLDNLLYIMPPFIISNEELKNITGVVGNAIKELMSVQYSIV